MKLVFASLVLLALFGRSVFAVQCYDCDLFTDSGCTDPFTAPSSVETTTCSGQCYKSSVSNNGEPISISRGCSEICLNLDCAEALGVKTCPMLCCSGDLCNSAGSVTFSVMAMATMVAATFGLF